MEKNRPYVRRLREERDAFLQKPAGSEFCVVCWVSIFLASLPAVCLPCMWLDLDNEALSCSVEPWTWNELFFSRHPFSPTPLSAAPFLPREAWRQILPVLFGGASYLMHHCGSFYFLPMPTTYLQRRAVYFNKLLVLLDLWPDFVSIFWSRRHSSGMELATHSASVLIVWELLAGESPSTTQHFFYLNLVAISYCA